jgi:MoaA/NifB/PqqE/SkfB family radical SAM enzyme
MNTRMALSQIRSALGILHGSRAFGGPLQVDLRLTNRCNLRCIHCYYYSPLLDVPLYNPLRVARRTCCKPPTRAAMKEMQHTDADAHGTRDLIEELLRMGTRRWQLGGNGEPFLHQSIMEVIEILKRSGSYCLANTNGTLIDTAIADELIAKGFDELRITTMAGTSEGYVRTHPGSTVDTFERLKRILMYIADRKTALNTNRPRVVLVMIVIAQNSGSITDFARFAADIRADRVLYRPVDDIEDVGLASLIPSETQVDSVLRQLTESQPFLESRGMGHNISNFTKIFGKQLDTRLLYQHIPCYYGWLAAMIDPDGMVYPCCRCYQPLGSIVADKFGAIWHGAAYAQFRRDSVNLNRRKSPLPDCDCYSCVHHTANLRLYRVLHPVKGRSSELENLRPLLSMDAG